MQLLRLTSCTVDLDSRCVRRDGLDTSLTPREVDVLRILAEQPNQIVPKEELVGAVWGHTSDKTLSVALRRLRTKLEVDPSNPEHLQMHRGVGVRLVIPDRPAVPGLLAPRTPLVGRDEDTALLHGLLQAGNRLITLMGPGGVGKTRLATEVALRWSHQGPVRFFDLATAQMQSDLIRIVATGLGVSVPPSDDAVQAILAHRRDGSHLWVLDNVEQVVEACGACLERWLPASRGTLFVVTSRASLGIPGERVIRLDPLDEDAAVELLRHTAPDLIEPTGEVTEPVRDLIRRVDGLPLALQLAAPVASVLGPAALLKRWTSLSATLTGPPGRHQSLDAIFRWSWDLLTEDERGCAVVLANLRATFDVAMVEALLGPDVAHPVLQRLVGCSLVHVEGGGTKRFRMLTLLRQAVLDQATDAQRQRGRDRHSQGIQQVLTKLVDRSEQGDLDAPFEVEQWLMDADAALHHAVATVDADAAFALVNPLLAMVARRGRRAYYGELLEVALAIPGGDEVARAEALYRLASVFMTQTSTAMPAATEALRISRKHGLRDLEGRALARVAGSMNQTDPGSGMETYREAVQIFDDDPTLPGWVAARFGYGVALLQSGDFEGTDAVLAKIPASAKAYDHLAMQTISVARLECSAHADAAEAAGLELVASCERLGDIDGVGRQLNNVGSTLMTRGLLARSQPYLERALARRRILGFVAETVIAAANLAAVHLQRGDLMAAGEQLAEAELVLGRSPGDRVAMILRIVRAEMLVRAGRRTEATDAIEAMKQIPPLWGTPRYRGILEIMEATLLGAQGDPAAEVKARAARASLSGRADLLQRVVAEVVHARVLMDLDRPTEARELAQRTFDSAVDLGHLRARGRAAAVLFALAVGAGDEAEAELWSSRALQDAEDPTVPMLVGPGNSDGDLTVSASGRTWSVEARWAAGR